MAAGSSIVTAPVVVVNDMVLIVVNDMVLIVVFTIAPVVVVTAVGTAYGGPRARA